MNKKLPKKVWAAYVNLHGLYSTEPIAMKLVSGLSPRFGDWKGRKWVQEQTDAAHPYLDVNKIGMDFRLRPNAPAVAFASRHKKEVQLFIAGVRAVYLLLVGMVHTEFDEPPKLRKEGK